MDNGQGGKSNCRPPISRQSAKLIVLLGLQLMRYGHATFYVCCAQIVILNYVYIDNRL